METKQNFRIEIEETPDIKGETHMSDSPLTKTQAMVRAIVYGKSFLRKHPMLRGCYVDVFVESAMERPMFEVHILRKGTRKHIWIYDSRKNTVILDTSSLTKIERFFNRIIRRR